MPLARILTRFPEHAGSLSEQLRRRGYTVEFSAPELAGKSAADLEIDFELCAEPDALNRASELAELLQTDVAISPGVVQDEGPTAALITNGHAEAILPAEPHDQISAGKIPAAEELVREAIAEPEPMPAEHAHFDSFVQESALDTNPQIVPEAETAFDDELEIARAATHETTAAELQAEFQEPAARSSAASEKLEEITAQAGEKSRAALQATAAALGGLWAATRHWAQQFRDAARQRSHEYGGQLEVRRAEMRAERQQKLLDLEKRRALAQERADELEAAREAAAARLQQLLRERGALTEAQPAPPQKPAAGLANPEAKAGMFSHGIFAHRVRLPLSRTHKPHLEAVLVGVAAACLLFVVGLAVASFHARPAISTTLDQPSSGVTVQSGGVTVKAGSPSPAVKSKPAAIAATPVQASGKPSAVVRQSSAKDVTIRNFPAAQRRSSPRASETDRVSGDVTIRHFGTPSRTQPAQPSPRAELKHYSDLDN